MVTSAETVLVTPAISTEAVMVYVADGVIVAVGKLEACSEIVNDFTLIESSCIFIHILNKNLLKKTQ